jgi:hypothetical protein
MRSIKTILSIVTVVALCVSPVLASSHKVPAEKKIQATVVTMEDDTLVVRKGNKDQVFKIDSSTHRPEGIHAGNKVTVNYHKDGKRYVASDIELSGTN